MGDIKLESTVANNIILEDRKKLIISGVREVCSFETDEVILKTTKGSLTIRGDNLHMENYSSDIGDLTATGNIFAIVYTNDQVTKTSFLSRVFK